MQDVFLGSEMMPTKAFVNQDYSFVLSGLCLPACDKNSSDLIQD